jgi:hypothetical protein
VELAIKLSGVLTALAGFGASLFPELILRLVFGILSTKTIWFFVRHWGLLIGLIGVLTILPIDKPVLIAAAIEKFFIVILVFFGSIDRTKAMTAVALVDGSFSILYVVYLVKGAML